MFPLPYMFGILFGMDGILPRCTKKNLICNDQVLRPWLEFECLGWKMGFEGSVGCLELPFLLVDF